MKSLHSNGDGSFLTLEKKIEGNCIHPCGRNIKRTGQGIAELCSQVFKPSQLSIWNNWIVLCAHRKKSVFFSDLVQVSWNKGGTFQNKKYTCFNYSVDVWTRQWKRKKGGRGKGKKNILLSKLQNVSWLKEHNIFLVLLLFSQK